MLINFSCSSVENTVSEYHVIHDAGLPWWATIVTTTIVLRALTFPLMLQSQRATPRYLSVMSKMAKCAEKIEQALSKGDNAEIHR